MPRLGGTYVVWGRFSAGDMLMWALIRPRVGGIIYGGYKLYQKFAKFDNDVQACKLQCENVASCGNPERTGQYQDNAARCITTCKSYSTVSDFFGIGKGPTGPKSPDPTPNYCRSIPPADGRP